MPAKSLLAATLVLLSPALAEYHGTWWSAGPVLRWSFGSGNGTTTEPAWSAGFEASIWTYRGALPLGSDLGLEWNGRALRLYAEAQAWLLLGASTGPALEWRGGEWNTGWQTSLWGAAPVWSASGITTGPVFDARWTVGLPGHPASFGLQAKAMSGVHLDD